MTGAAPAHAWPSRHSSILHITRQPVEGERSRGKHFGKTCNILCRTTPIFKQADADVLAFFRPPQDSVDKEIIRQLIDA